MTCVSNCRDAGEDAQARREHYVAALMQRKLDCRDWRLVLTGHSLGAGAAALMALHLSGRFPSECSDTDCLLSVRYTSVPVGLPPIDILCLKYITGEDTSCGGGHGLKKSDCSIKNVACAHSPPIALAQLLAVLNVVRAAAMPHARLWHSEKGQNWWPSSQM